MKLKDKVAVITGAASGIGYEIALTFLAEGAKIVIADLGLERAEAAAAKLDPLGENSMGVDMNVTDEDAVEKGMKAVVEKFGRIDILVSNAGV